MASLALNNSEQNGGLMATHAVVPHCRRSTPDLFDIWQGHAVIFA
jgi:hypothetical protein